MLKGSVDFHIPLNANRCLYFSLIPVSRASFSLSLIIQAVAQGGNGKLGVTTGRKLRKAVLLEKGRDSQGRPVNCDVEGLVTHHKNWSRPGQVLVQVTFERWALNRVPVHLSTVPCKISLEGCVALMSLSF